MTTVPPALHPPRTANLPVFATTIATWRMALRAFADIPVPAAVTFFFFILYELFAPSRGGIDSIDMLPSAILPSTVKVMIGVVLMVIVYRYVLLHEVPSKLGSSVFVLNIRGFSPLVKFAIALDALILVMIEVPPLLFDSDAAKGAAVLLAVIAATYLSVKTTLYMPSLAIDAPQPTLSNAWRDSQGYVWQIVLVVICTFIPTMIFGYLIRGTAAGTGDLLFTQSPLHAVFNAALDTWMVVCSAVLEAYVFVALANRLGRPANVVLVPAS
jgi:hypothetical protein